MHARTITRFPRRAGVDTRTQFVDDAATVGALDQWPRGRLVPAAVLALNRAVGSARDVIGRDLDVSAVPTEAGVDLGVVHARRQDLEPNLPGCRNRYGYLLDLDHLEAAVAEGHGGDHRPGHDRSVGA